MRTVRFDAFGGMPYVAEVPMPAAAAGGAVIRVEAAGLCRSDWHGWQGHDPDIPSLPHIPGHEFAGVVHAVGDGVRRVRVGDRVVVPFICGCGECAWCVSGSAQVCPNQWQPGFHGPGCYGEFAAIPWADFNLVALPGGLPFEVAASLGCRFATAYRGIVDVAGVRAGEWVAVFGCGGVGLAAVMIARSRGARVIGIDVNGRALALATQAGAESTVDASTGDPVEMIRAVVPHGVDVAVDALGSAGTAGGATRSLRITAAICRSASCHRRRSVIMPPSPCTWSSAVNSASTAATAWRLPTTRACSPTSPPGCLIPHSSSRARSPSAMHPVR